AAGRRHLHRVHGSGRRERRARGSEPGRSGSSGRHPRARSGARLPPPHRPRQPAARTVDGQGPPRALREEPSRPIAAGRDGPPGRGLARVSAPLAVLLALDRRVHAKLERWSAPFAVSALFRSCSVLGDGWLWVLGVAVIVRVAARPWSDLASAV